MMGKSLFELRTGFGACPKKMELDIQLHACHNGSAVFFKLFKRLKKPLYFVVFQCIIKKYAGGLICQKN